MRQLLIGISIIGIFFVQGQAALANQSMTQKCVPFAVKEVPDETNLRPVKWVFYDSTVYDEASVYTYPDGSQVWFRIARYYKDVEKTGLHLGVYEFFGQLAFKAWACDVGKDPVTKDKPDHMVAVLKDGKWYTANVQHPEIMKVYGKDGLLSGVKITLHDKNGRVIVERIINR